MLRKLAALALALTIMATADANVMDRRAQPVFVRVFTLGEGKWMYNNRNAVMWRYKTRYPMWLIFGARFEDGWLRADFSGRDYYKHTLQGLVMNFRQAEDKRYFGYLAYVSYPDKKFTVTLVRGDLNEFKAEPEHKESIVIEAPTAKFKLKLSVENIEAEQQRATVFYNGEEVLTKTFDTALPPGRRGLVGFGGEYGWRNIKAFPADKPKPARPKVTPTP